MAEEGLKIVIGADVVQVTKSLNQLEKEFQDLGKALKSAIPGTAEFTRLSQEFNKQSVIINRVNQASQAAGTGLGKNLKAGAQEATFALSNFGRVAQDAPFGLIGIANNIDPLIQSFISLRASTGSASAAFSALGASLLGPGGIIFAVSAVTSALSFYALSQRGANKETKDRKQLVESLATVESEYANIVAKELVTLKNLFTTATNTALSYEVRKNAANELLKTYPEYLKNLNAEKIISGEAATQYINLANAIQKSALARAAANIQTQNQQQIITLQFEQDQLREEREAKILAIRQRYAQAIKNEVRENYKILFAKAREQEINNANVEFQDKIIDKQKVINKLSFDNIKLSNLIQQNQTTPFKLDNPSINKSTVEAEKLFTAFKQVESAILVGNSGLKEQAELQKDINRLLLASEQLRKGGIAPSIDSPDQRANPEKSPIQQLELLSGEFTKLDEQAKLVSDTINNGINQGIDTFFNALANNQDPFKALIQSVQRLVVELGAAVVKSLILKTIANSIAPGSGLAIGGLQSAGSNILRSDLLRLAITR